MAQWTIDDKRMLYLASAAYRGVFSSGTWSTGHAATIGDAVQGCLDSAPADIGTWRIVWGPAVHRTAHGVFDDGLVYVASDGDRYAVVVRGTNPVSLTDWLFGDLLIKEQVEWPFDSGALLSLSTALGLATILSAGSKEPITGPLAQLRAHVAKGLQQVTLEEPAQFLSATVSDVSGESDLVGFLSKAIASRKVPVELLVTGHSKGAALAAALAQWFVDSQGNDRPEHSGWAGSNVQLGCRTYAGPTPGNAIFGQRIQRSMGQEFRRVWNRCDLVPHAFDTLEEVRTYYEDAVVLQPAINKLNAVVEGKYAQVGPGLAFPDQPKPHLLLAAPAQHLDAYLAELGIPHSALWFIGFMGFPLLNRATQASTTGASQ